MAIASKLSLEEIKSFDLETAYDAWLLAKNNRLGFRVTEDRWLISENNVGDANIKRNLTVGGDLDIGGTIFFRQGLVVEGDTWLKNKVRIEEDTTLDGDVYIHANLYVSKNFQLAQDGSIRGNLSVEDSLTVNDLTVTGNAQIDSILDVNNDINVLGDASIGGTLNISSKTEAVYECSTTENVSALTYSQIDLLVAGITVTLDDLQDNQIITIKNLSTGIASFNHDVLFQGEVLTAPINMPIGDSYPMRYDLANTRFIL